MEFDEQLVLHQLITSSTISYTQFVRFGYSKHVTFPLLIDAFKQLDDKLYKMCSNRSIFYSKILLLIGLKLNDFKIGNEAIFFRLNKYYLLENFLLEARAVSHFKICERDSSTEIAKKCEPK